MPRGGFRANAGRRKKDGSPPAPAQRFGGRQKGTPNKANAVRAERARASGIMASEGMLDLGRFCKNICAMCQPEIKEIDVVQPDGSVIKRKTIAWSAELKSTFIELAKLALDAFGKSAPYFEQKLASVHEIRRVNLERLTDAELDQLETIVASASDEAGDTGREVETRH